MFRIVFLSAIALCALPAQASTWKLMDARAEGMLNFYDADTVEKHGDTVTIWRKMVFDESKPMADGIYSKAQKMVFNCTKKTYQIVDMSNYGKDHKFINAIKIPSEDTAPKAGSVAEYLMDEVCATGFPTAKPQIKNNDVYSYSKYIFDGMHQDSAPQ